MTKTNTMDFLPTGSKTSGVREMKNKVSDDYLGKITTSRILWHLTKRHKFGIVVLWAGIVTIDSLFPPVWDILGSLIA